MTFPSYGVSTAGGTNLAQIGTSGGGMVVLDIAPHRPWETAEVKALVATLKMAVADAEREVAALAKDHGEDV